MCRTCPQRNLMFCIWPKIAFAWIEAGCTRAIMVHLAKALETTLGWQSLQNHNRRRKDRQLLDRQNEKCSEQAVSCTHRLLPEFACRLALGIRLKLRE